MKEKIIQLTGKKQALLAKLVEPARAAANQMKDAGMSRGADPLLEILFQVDACEQEIMELFSSEPKAAMAAVFDLMRGQ